MGTAKVSEVEATSAEENLRRNAAGTGTKKMFRKFFLYTQADQLQRGSSPDHKKPAKKARRSLGRLLASRPRNPETLGRSHGQAARSESAKGSRPKQPFRCLLVVFVRSEPLPLRGPPDSFSNCPQPLRLSPCMNRSGLGARCSQNRAEFHFLSHLFGPAIQAPTTHFGGLGRQDFANARIGGVAKKGCAQESAAHDGNNLELTLKFFSTGSTI